MSHTDQIIPASPGWFVLHPVVDGDSGEMVEFGREPIIAWRIQLRPFRAGLGPDERYAWVLPVTYEDWGDDDPVLRPDGQIVFRDEVTFNNESEALAHMTESRRELRHMKTKSGDLSP